MRECKEKLKIVHLARDSRLDLAACSLLASRQTMHTSEACRGAEESTSWSIIGQKVQLVLSVNSQLGLTTQSSREAKPSVHFVWEKLTLRIPYTHQYKYPFYSWNLKNRMNFKRETLEKNKIDSSTIFIDSSTIFTYWFSKFLNSHPLHCYILERSIRQIFFSPYLYLWKGFLVLGKQLGRDQLILIDVMGYSGIR